MIVFLLIVLAIALWDVRLCEKGTLNSMSIEQTNNIKGLFSFVILLSHLKQYVEMERPTDFVYSQSLSYIGQLMVAPFLFYSGYGVIYGIDNKENYEQQFLAKRIGKTWFEFVLALVVFGIANLCTGVRHSAKTILLSLIAWESIGNSNWFVFDILVLYAGVYLISRAIPKVCENKIKVLIYVIIMMFWTILLIKFVVFFEQYHWWYDTLLCFPFGAIFYLLKPTVDDLWKNSVAYWVSGAIAAIYFRKLYVSGDIVQFCFCSCVFCLLIVWVNSRVKIGNPILDWAGKHSFYIYIYMRVPMNVLRELSFNKNAVLFSFASIVLTMSLASTMKKVTCFIEEKWSKI